LVKTGGIVFALLLAMYVGTYYALVNRYKYDKEYPIYRPVDFLSPWQWRLRTIFGPIHWVDHYMIRPNYWKE
jgi:hypothetical protein